MGHGHASTHEGFGYAAPINGLHQPEAKGGRRPASKAGVGYLLRASDLT
jgi:hypothetical protein